MLQKKILNASMILAVLFLVCIAVYAWAGSAESAVADRRERIEFSEEWTYEQEGRKNLLISLPFADTPTGTKTFCLSKNLPNVFLRDTVLYMKSYRNDVKAYIGEQRLCVKGIYPGSTEDALNGEMWVSIPLKPEYAGRTLTLILKEKNNAKGINLENVQILSQNELDRILLTSKVIPVILSVSMLTVAVILFVLGVLWCWRSRSPKGKVFSYLSLFVFLASFWILLDSRTLELFTAYQDVQYSLSVYLLMLMPIPLILYVRATVFPSSNVLNIFIVLFLIVFFGNLIQKCLGGNPSMRQTMFGTHILICLLLPTLLYLCQKVYYENGYIPKMYWGILIFAIISIGAIVLWYKNNEGYAMTFYLGYFTLMIFLSIGSIKYAAEIIRQAQESSENLNRAAEATNTLRVNQIGSHFFYHVMNTTRVLTKTNPDAAYQMLGDISKYLRYKTDSRELPDGMVKFCEEIKAVYAYVDMKKVILGERLSVVYDLESTDFYIPVLTIQPLVENAIEYAGV